MKNAIFVETPIHRALADFDTSENKISKYLYLYDSYIQIISFAEVPEIKV